MKKNLTELKSDLKELWEDKEYPFLARLLISPCLFIGFLVKFLIFK